MNTNIFVTNKSKCLLLVLSFSIFVSVIFYYGKIDILGVNANPDYICVKALTDQPCIATNYPASCSAWGINGKRTCPGKKATEVRYLLRRTSCESGYTRYSRSESDGSSGRQTADYVSKSVDCSITEEDIVPPEGKIQ
ncbi:MAG: hypothetical protein Q8K30_06630 [Candidatus Gracilibacteria bacterium]|nr:hypothetical protein [Candidatus Gracilibacteria bacterium]